MVLLAAGGNVLVLCISVKICSGQVCMPPKNLYVILLVAVADDGVEDDDIVFYAG
jgi:hypothetical protein